jgi:hypothetical protein
MTLRLANVRSLTVRLRDAGFRKGQRGTLHVTTDGPTAVHLCGRVVYLSKGQSTVHFRV